MFYSSVKYLFLNEHIYLRKVIKKTEICTNFEYKKIPKIDLAFTYISYQILKNGVKKMYKQV